ncbi:MAG TPA: ATP-grasp domain-containing protein [Vitreimonas sp.]|nr:ATP-grasp domain-containing protein [Vitreimonas sp.]
MMLLEHDAKELLRARGLPVPQATLVRARDAHSASLSAPVVVKAQAPVGGRGKAGGIVLCQTEAEASTALARILGMQIKGHAVRACRLEAPVAYQSEAYLSFMVDPAHANVRVLMSASGGVEIESQQENLLATSAEANANAIAAAAAALAAPLPAKIGEALVAAATPLAEAFIALEATLLEINPLFVAADGAWTIGDAKLVLDDNAYERSAAFEELMARQADLYPEMAFKLAHGFDYVELDPQGDIGLITTGAGLSMQLVDELTARGLKPFNFCDIRTGGFRGEPDRLIDVLQRIAAGPNIRTALINFFAGSTDLAEIARLLLLALERVPAFNVPVVARMIGNNYDAARGIIADAGDPIRVEPDLEKAIALAIANAKGDAR